MIKRLAILFTLLTSPLAVAGAGTADDAARQLLDSFVNDVITFQASFEQALLDADETVIERSTGTLEIERPGRFRWSYVEPYEQWLIADGLNMWSYDVDLAQVTVKAQAEALANTPALLLGGSEDALQQFDIDDSYVEGAMTWVRLIPNNTDSGFERVDLGFVAGTLSRMAFFDNLQQTTLIALDDVVVNEPIEDSRFAFVPPEDVDVVGTPAEAAAAP
ncbi:MAG: outer membrane lipoprotein chaperone LolA [Woeseiaceae bacterium]